MANVLTKIHFWRTLPQSFLHNTKKYSFIVADLSYTHQDSDVVLCPIQGLFLPCLLPDYARIIIHVDDTSLPRQIGNEKC